jgi:hypothetical protein
MAIEKDFLPETASAPEKPERPDRGPRLFVTIVAVALLGVIGWALLTGRDGFVSSVNKFFNATPAPSATPSDAATPTTSP